MVTRSEIGNPMDTGYGKLPGTTGEVLNDAADVRYIREYIDRGQEPSFFISNTPALRDPGDPCTHAEETEACAGQLLVHLTRRSPQST